jgi:hypothetical protein
MMAKKLLVDIHTHVYLPRYASVLRSRSSVPLIRTNTSTQQERLLILDHEPSGGRPVGPQYWDREGTYSGIEPDKSAYGDLVQRNSSSWTIMTLTYPWSGERIFCQST